MFKKLFTCTYVVDLYISCYWIRGRKSDKRNAINIEHNGNIRLQKIISDSLNMIKSFPVYRWHTKRYGELSYCAHKCNLPVQHNLGILWDLSYNVFVFKISIVEKPYTHRGLKWTASLILRDYFFSNNQQKYYTPWTCTSWISLK